MACLSVLRVSLSCAQDRDDVRGEVYLGSGPARLKPDSPAAGRYAVPCGTT
jgi:hypothetical protein